MIVICVFCSIIDRTVREIRDLKKALEDKYVELASLRSEMDRKNAIIANL